jgi:radical SAM protein with 4Fe4S-binding SPASM domain
MIQKRKNVKDNTYTLFNTNLDVKLEISSDAARLLRKIHNNITQTPQGIKKKELDFIDELSSLGFLCEETQSTCSQSVYLANRSKYRLPLTALNIELTNSCNLRCTHCYGSFSETQSPSFVPYEWVLASLSELNNLHTQSISLTGGEPTIHPNFIEIALYYLKNGFELCVFTNGFNYGIIERFLEMSKDYKFKIKISLDGYRDMHNLIRGRDRAFENAIRSIHKILEYNNVTAYISTSAMKTNIDIIDSFKKYIKSEFPSAIHTNDLVFPSGSADNCTFSLAEFDTLYRTNPSLFRYKEEEGDLEQNSKKEFRCSGGISQSTMSSDGSIKICNAACADVFKFKNNVYVTGLTYAWLHCGKNIKKYRKEKAHKTIDCKACNYYSICSHTDCRVMAWVYMHDETRSNPLICFSVNKSESEVRI